MDKQYREWRESEVKKVGAKVQNEADAILDKRDKEPFVEVNDDVSGLRKRHKRSVAEVLIRKGEASTVKVYTSPNSQAYKDNYDKIDWSKG